MAEINTGYVKKATAQGLAVSVPITYLFAEFKGWFFDLPPVWAVLFTIGTLLTIGIVTGGLFLLVGYCKRKYNWEPNDVIEEAKESLEQINKAFEEITRLKEQLQSLIPDNATTPSVPTSGSITDCDKYGVQIKIFQGHYVAYFNEDNIRNIPQVQVTDSQLAQIVQTENYPIVINLSNSQKIIQNAIYSKGTVYKTVMHNVFDMDYHDVNPDAAATQEYNEMMLSDKPLKYLVEHHNTLDIKLEILAKDNEAKKQAYRNNLATLELAIQNLYNTMPLREQQAEARRVYNKLVAKIV